MKKEIANTPASIHHRLLNLARSTNQPFNQLLYIFANERFLYRLSVSPFKTNFILKGAMAILNFALEYPRYTRDIDFLGFTENSVDNIVQITREICAIDAKDDGLTFDLNSVTGEVIKENDEYSGVRVMLDAYLGKAKIRNLQIDVGIGDLVYPQPKEEVYHGLLDLPKPVINIYPLEAILSEKIHALEQHGFLNSRMKDIYDIWDIVSNKKFEGVMLSEALRLTFNNRQTPIPESLVIFDNDFLNESKFSSWKSVGKKLQSVDQLPDLNLIINQLQNFLIPIMNALFQEKEFTLVWDPSKDWGWQ
jgi:predicted nucleotidyltransferase component of viral defense system